MQEGIMKKLILLLLIVCAAGCSMSETLVSPYDVPNMDSIEEVVRYINKTNFANCRETAETAEIACRSLGYDTLMISLRGKDRHRVCIAWNKPDEWHLFTSYTGENNYKHYLILADDWEYPTLSAFNGIFKSAVVLFEHNQGGIE